MSRLRSAAALAALAFGSTFAALPAAAERLSLPVLSDYLGDIGAAEARFTQINADGSRLGGTLYIKRPGRIRFEYDPPQQDTLVLASGGQIAVFDGRGSGAPEQYPLRSTPLAIILDRNVDLTRARMVTGHGEQNGRTIVQAQDPDNPEYGRIYLYFENDPIRLAEWMIISESGEQTRTLLGPLQPRAELSDFLFSIPFETEKRQ
ncbi:cell envelope biogenesis protein LolA [Meridianimarinicoccus roseus]|uniref:Cell envelope biogenesis protein LolA n=1 Tax=Meridianimarinicoccus roseus TaxID=2072018 RepID=A0A2V2LFB2_9RHOB|nr:outer membrane lipoprotein carrier protein LolA [Meridianimarinicoccus roseus]PWR01926.1 cell envelope biogenesis protein LolA [Meridianimarinicoccus roseus]